ncbi:Lrp/AsnC family transcriptional regulator [Nonomuraea sp. LPB2021202275-12-8]|uniref:Lrp/AsnC family transcriptional regulator n=1 Tax=Nonomuraea sp. LPB2021202275-12-8 TaxID=3120159 RepID=UPI00300D94CA
MNERHDSLDALILRRLQHDGRSTAEDIGAEIGLSGAAVSRRISRLRKAGIIAKEVAILNPKSVGLPLTFVVGVELERERRDVIDEFRARMRADEIVQQCYYVTGSFDFVIVLHARDMSDYEAFTSRTMFENPNIRRFTTMVVMDRVKVGLTVPLLQWLSEETPE